MGSRLRHQSDGILSGLRYNKSRGRQGGNHMAKISGKGLLAVALALSLATSLLVYQYLQGTTNKTIKDGVPVVTAKVDIPAKSPIKAEMLQTVMMPVEYVQTGTVGDAQSIVGMMAREKIMAGEAVTARRLLMEGKSSGFTGLIPRDKRAVSVAVSEVSGVAGFVKAGDYVDVVVTFDGATVGDNASAIVLQNILVLAANRESEASGEEGSKNKPEVAKATTVTLAVAPQDAARLALSEDKGKVRLALRPYQPAEEFALVTAVTPKDMFGVHNSPAKGDGDTGGGQRQSNSSEGGKNDPAWNRDSAENRIQTPAEGKGIILIRGTKAETVPVH